MTRVPSQMRRAWLVACFASCGSAGPAVAEPPSTLDEVQIFGEAWAPETLLIVGGLEETGPLAEVLLTYLEMLEVRPETPATAVQHCRFSARISPGVIQHPILIERE